MSSKLIAIDLDGTTLNDESLLSTRTIRTLRTLQNAGHHVVIATGRPYRISKDIYEEIGLHSPMINFNGALCHVPNNKNWKNFFHKTLDADLAMDIFRKKDLFEVSSVIIEGKEEIYSSIEQVPENVFFPANTRSTFINGESSFKENPTAMNLFTTLESQEEIRSRILQEYGSDVISVRTWGGIMPCLEIVSSGIQKALGVEIVAHSYGIKREDILAFGDEDNDLEMIDFAGHGVVMKNGIDSLKKIANDMTSHTNNDDGLAIYLEEYFKL